MLIRLEYYAETLREWRKALERHADAEQEFQRAMDAEKDLLLIDERRPV